MSGGRTVVGKSHPRVEDVTEAGGCLPLRRDVSPAVIGESLAEIAEIAEIPPARKTMSHVDSNRSAISRSLPSWILRPLAEGVRGKSSTANTRSGTL